MSTRAPWWDESRRYRLLGYGLRSGSTRTHVAEVRENGPGAVGVRVLCGGMQSLSWVDSGLDLTDQAACEAFQRSFVTESAAGRATCPRCLDRLQRRTKKAS